MHIPTNCWRSQDLGWAELQGGPRGLEASPRTTATWVVWRPLSAAKPTVIRKDCRALLGSAGQHSKRCHGFPRHLTEFHQTPPWFWWNYVNP